MGVVRNRGSKAQSVSGCCLGWCYCLAECSVHPSLFVCLPGMGTRGDAGPSSQPLLSALGLPVENLTPPGPEETGMPQGPELQPVDGLITQFDPMWSSSAGLDGEGTSFLLLTGILMKSMQSCSVLES